MKICRKNADIGGCPVPLLWLYPCILVPLYPCSIIRSWIFCVNISQWILQFGSTWRSSIWKLELYGISSGFDWLNCCSQSFKWLCYLLLLLKMNIYLADIHERVGEIKMNSVHSALVVVIQGSCGVTSTRNSGSWNILSTTDNASKIDSYSSSTYTAWNQHPYLTGWAGI
jgi:hypothetical protein